MKAQVQVLAQVEEDRYPELDSVGPDPNLRKKHIYHSNLVDRGPVRMTTKARAGHQWSVKPYLL
jgi:hypothetical protein